MTRLGAVLLLLVLLAAALVISVGWRAGDSAPDELVAVTKEAARLPGVVAVDIERSELPVGVARGFEPEPSRVDVSVRLAATLTPADAAATAERVYALLVPVAETVADDAVSTFLRVTAGEPEEGIGAVAGHPLELRYTAVSADDVADAFTIWQAGARRVQVYGGESPVGDSTAAEFVPPSDPAGIGIEAADPAELIPLASLAAELGRAADLRSSDDSTRYEAHGSAPDVDAVRLAVATASRPGVESAVFSNSTPPQLSVYTVGRAESPENQTLRSWLEAQDYATAVGHPVAFVISEPGYAMLTEGWVSAFPPPEPEQYALPLPPGVDSWPGDASAPDCTGAELELRFGGSDAATGSRYALLLARNVSAQPCAVEGVPEVVFRPADGAARKDIRLEPYGPGVVPARLVVPPGEEMLAPLQWRAMSTANDPDLTTSIDVVAVPGAEPVLLDVAEHQPTSGGLDILDGAEVRLGPWVQALEGWS